MPYQISSLENPGDDMCGIAGVIDYRHNRNSVDTVKAMLRSISYRGPDGSGIYHSPAATIGNVRLSIIDIKGGHQPLSDQTGRYWIVFNGEIYNYLELRRELEGMGVVFQTNSDTEVLVQYYAREGKRCLERLNGQFAFAIWDNETEELFMARDRVGIRPLFYNFSGGVLSFASEIKSLFRQPEVSREFDYRGLLQVYSYWSTLTPNTVFKNIRELSPGHYLTYSKKGLSTGRYWQLRIQPRASSISPGEAKEQFNEIFTSSVRLRLRADVEVAAYLSGGLDSTSTVAYIKEIEPGVLNTFSIGFDDKQFDESEFQEEAVRHLQTRHSFLNCTSADIAEAFPSVVWHSETPLLRTAPAPMLLLSEYVRNNNIKVVMTGEGADEILAGYDIFRETMIRLFWASQPSSTLRPLLLKKIYSDIPHLRNGNPALLRMFFGFRLEDVKNPFYSHLLRWNNSNHIIKHLSENITESLKGYSPLDELVSLLPEGFDSWDPLAKAQWIETTLFMSGYLLSSQGDRMIMANSVEGRYPFLDHRLIEFTAGLPADFKLKGLNEKYLLKKMMTGKIPDRILRRPKKPYRAPVSSVFLSKNAPDYVRLMLSEEYTRRAGLFNHESLRMMLKRISRNGIVSEIDNMVLTGIVSGHLLYEQFIGQKNENVRHENDLGNIKVIYASKKERVK